MGKHFARPDAAYVPEPGANSRQEAAGEARAYAEGRSQARPEAGARAQVDPRAQSRSQSGAAARPATPRAQTGAPTDSQAYDQPNPYARGDAPVNAGAPTAARPRIQPGAQPRSQAAASPRSAARIGTSTRQAGTYVPGSQDDAPNPYASHTHGFATPYTPPQQGPDAADGAQENPYAAGATHGAVGMSHEQVGPHARQALRAREAAERAADPRRRTLTRRAAIVVLAGLVAGGGYLFFNPPFYSVTVDGTSRSVNGGATLGDLIKEGLASPKAGNLIAVDGSVAQQGGGEPFEATVNGTQTTDPSFKVPRGATVEFADGADVNEDYDEQTQTVAHGTSGGADTEAESSYYQGAIHIYSEGQDGEQTVRTGKVSGKTVTEVTKQPVSAGYHVYNANVGTDKVVALTFDDGPWPTTTAEILDILKENGAHATFFEIGNQVAENADVVKRIHAEGNQIGSHTWDHAAGSGHGVDLTRMSSDEQLQEVQKGFKAIEDTLGTTVNHVLRAPGGNYHGSIIATLKDTITAEVGWDIDTEDWRRPGAPAIEQAILSAKPGQVVLMHDGGGDRSQTVEALKTALPQLKAKGYSFITIDELLAYGVPAGK